MDSDLVTVILNNLLTARENHDRRYSRISEFETQVIGIEFIRSHPDNGTLVYRVVDQRKFQMARLKHGI